MSTATKGRHYDSRAEIQRLKDEKWWEQQEHIASVAQSSGIEESKVRMMQ